MRPAPPSPGSSTRDTAEAAATEHVETVIPATLPDAGTATTGGSPPIVTPAGRFGPLRSRNFRWLWLGSLSSNVGTWMASTAESWLVTELEPNRKAFAIGLIAISFALPMLFLPLVGGAIADRVPRLRLLRIAQWTYISLSATLTVLTLSGLVNLWMLMGYAFLTGTILAFDSPTRQALLPELVDRSRMTAAVSLNASVFTGAALVGPALAGLLIPIVGAGGVFAVNTVSYVAVLWALSQIRDVPERSHRAREPESVRRTINSGITYVRATPVIATLLLLSLLTGLFGRSYGPLLAVFARDVFDVGPIAFGFLVAAPGLGTLGGALWLGSRGEIGAKGRWLLIATLGLSVVLSAVAVAPSYRYALPLLLVAGLCSTVASALVATLLQLNAPHAMRGRVMGYYTLTLIGIPALGTLLLGIVATGVGVRAAVGGTAVVLALVTVLVFLMYPRLRAG